MKKISVVNLEWDIGVSDALALFGRPISESDEVGLLKSGLKSAAIQASGCLGWIWKQWLSGASKDVIYSQVSPFVERSLDLRARCKYSYYMLPQHDLLLLNCAILAMPESQLKYVVAMMADSSGDKGETPADNGELYAAAWCGTLKWWILGDLAKALQESEKIWPAFRDQFFSLRAAANPLVGPWLKRDWSSFMKRQNKDFDQLWARARKSNWIVRSETESEVVVTTNRLLIERDWCWSHCGLALLAYRFEGVPVATDPFWFPPHALECVDRIA